MSVDNLWIVCPQPKRQARLRLFCIPYAGGGASVFRAWAAHFPQEVEVCAIQLPGRENRLRETPFTSMQEIVQALTRAIRSYLRPLPFAFFGHSMGGLIAFELARYLCIHTDFNPAFLFVSGCRAPQLPNPHPLVYNLPPAEFLKRIREFQGTPEAVLQNAELMQLLVPLLQADLTVFETYTYMPGSRLDCPISAFGGLEDSEVSYEELKAWDDQTSQAFHLRMFPGNHFFLQNARLALLHAISQDLMKYLREVGEIEASSLENEQAPLFSGEGS
jgi:medium-chain acyl-[acyl-carrier-protein] hydrolase